MDVALHNPREHRQAEPPEGDSEFLREIARLRREGLALRCDVGYWRSRHADAVQREEKLREELDHANAEIRQLKTDQFGKKSEKQSSTDRSNDLDDPQLPKPPKKKRGQQPGRPGPARRDYSHLPVREEFLDASPEDRVCDGCGKPLADLGETEDSEQVEVEFTVHRRRMRRRRYRKTCDCPGSRTLTAPKPPKLIPKGRLGVSAWVHLLLEKFHAARPMQRTIEQLTLLGLPLAPGTVTGGLKRIERLLEPIYAALRERNTQSSFHHADETRWLVFVEKDGKSGPRWWLWVFVGEDTVVYVLDPSRSRKTPESHFPDDFEGVLMVDRYSAYQAMKQVKEGKLVLAFCWAHVRRDFVRIGKGYPELKDWALTWLRRIRDLYRLQRARRREASDAPGYASADAALREHVAAMRRSRDAELADEQLRAPCCTALRSLTKHWSGLTLFLDDSRIPLDNNFAERLMRNPAVARKNYYGSGAEWAGRLAMMMFSLFETLKLGKINPRLWLTWYLESCAARGGESPTDVTPFLPWNLTEERRAALTGHPM
ncbi:MAG: IS66 family transposase, partial [Planctomycetales bacterium]